MPNTLAHIGVQTLLLRGGSPAAAVPWLLLGCLIPDLAWILHRLFPLFLDGATPASFYELRLYSIAQSSLAVSLLLCAGLAALSRRPLQVLGLLGISCLIHLLLDATQIKPGNGVHLLAPLSWELLHFGLYWPESWPTYLQTGLGLLAVVYLWLRPGDPVRLLVTPARLLLAVLLASAYLSVPWWLRAGPLAADNHSVATLRDVAARPGKLHSFDRDAYTLTDAGPQLRTFARENLCIASEVAAEPGRISGVARFVDTECVEILEVHQSQRGARDVAVIAGLIFVLLSWIRPGAVEIQFARSEASADV